MRWLRHRVLRPHRVIQYQEDNMYTTVVSGSAFFRELVSIYGEGFSFRPSYKQTRDRGKLILVGREEGNSEL